jgi:hypothetical protein
MEKESQARIDFSRDKNQKINNRNFFWAPICPSRRRTPGDRGRLFDQLHSFCHVERSRDISNFFSSIRTEEQLNSKRFLDFASLRSK